MGKKGIYWSVLVLLLLFCAHGYGQETGKERTVIVIDAGHGGADSGAVSENGLMEKEVVLDIAYWMLHWNRELFDNGLDIFLTRDRDTLISLSDRTKVSRALRPDLFLSLHCNHSGNSMAKGMEAYVHSTEGPYSKASKETATALLMGLEQRLGFAQRGLKEGNFHVLRDNSDVCPAVLLELGFLSREEESGYLGKSSKRCALALAILESIHRQWKSLGDLGRVDFR